MLTHCQVLIFWGMGVFSPVAGRLAGRVGRHRAIAICLTMALIALGANGLTARRVRGAQAVRTAAIG